MLLVGDTGFEPVTSSVSGKRATAAPIAQNCHAIFFLLCEVEMGFEPTYTALQAAASPLGHSTVESIRTVRSATADERLRANDGIRTRDPHLGKVMRYQLRHVRTPNSLWVSPAAFRCVTDFSRQMGR